MTQDLRLSIWFMRELVAKLRAYPFAEAEAADRDAVIEIVEEQIREMEARSAKQSLVREEGRA